VMSNVLVEFLNLSMCPGLAFFEIERELSEILGPSGRFEHTGISESIFPRPGDGGSRERSMSVQREVIRLRHMLDYAQEAVALVHGRTRADLEDRPPFWSWH